MNVHHPGVQNISKNIVTTSVIDNYNLYFLRFFECNGQKTKLEIFNDDSLKIDGLETIDGNNIKEINPYKIGNIKVIT